MRTLVAVLALTVILGCGKSDPSSEPSRSSDDITPKGQGTDIVASVGSNTLTRIDMDTELNVRMGALRPQPPPERLESVRERMRGAVINQFVTKSLLMDEAARVGITVTAEEEAEAFASIAKDLPEGKTLKEVMQNSIMGEEKMRREVIIGITISKLLEQELADEITVSEADLNTFMTENAERLKRPAQVKARHILVKVDAGAEASTRAKARTDIEAARQRIVDGEEFGAVAAEVSSCPSAKQGGDLGYFGKGRMVKAFEDAAFTQAVEEVGPVVETPFGFHVIEVTEKRDAGSIPADEARKLLEARKRQMAMQAYVTELREKADVQVATGQGAEALR